MRGRNGSWAALAVIAALQPARADAQEVEGMDAHGFYLVAQDGDPRDLLTVSRPGRFHTGEFWFTGAFEYADSPLVRREHYPLGNQEDVTTKQLGSLAALNLSVGAAVHGNVRFDLTAPVYFLIANEDDSGAGLGDLRLSSMIALARPRPGFAGGAGLALVPFLDLPTGSASRFVGKGGIAGGAKMAFTAEVGRLTLSGDIGAVFNPKRDMSNLSQSSAILGGGGLGVLVTDDVGINAEAHFQPPLEGASLENPNVDRSILAGTASPAEALLSVRGRTKGGFHWGVGGAKGITGGAGAANFRVFAQVGYGRIVGSEGDMDLDGIADTEDACLREKETVNLFEDTDGCPDAGGRVHVVVRLKGQTEEYVTVSLIDAEGGIAGQFETTLPDPAYAEVPSGTYTVKADLPGFRANQEVSVDNGRVDVTLDLVPLTPGRLKVTVSRADGKKLDRAGLSIVGDGAPDAAGMVFGPDGVLETDVPPGKFLLFIKAPGAGVFRKDIVIEPGKTLVINASLGEARASIATDRIQLNESVYFETNAATIKSESYPLLEEVANLLLSSPDILQVEIQGHTDAEASDEYNLSLSQERAASVRAFLIERGVKPDRLTAVGYGESMPISDNGTAEGRALNRRVEFVITKRVQR